MKSRVGGGVWLRKAKLRYRRMGQMCVVSFANELQIALHNERTRSPGNSVGSARLERGKLRV